MSCIGAITMKVEFPDARPLTPEEQDEYNRLKTIIERAIADKVVTEAEVETIRATALRNKPSPELLYQQLRLYRELVTDKVNQGLLIAERFGELG